MATVRQQAKPMAETVRMNCVLVMVVLMASIFGSPDSSSKEISKCPTTQRSTAIAAIAPYRVEYCYLFVAAWALAA